MATDLIQTLYARIPERLLVSGDGMTWYACYDNDLCILSNASGELEAFCYDDKGEYRDVRRHITENYNVRKAKVSRYDEHN
jgi:hypothetical protein